MCCFFFSFSFFFASISSCIRYQGVHDVPANKKSCKPTPIEARKQDLLPDTGISVALAPSSFALRQPDKVGLGGGRVLAHPHPTIHRLGLCGDKRGRSSGFVSFVEVAEEQKNPCSRLQTPLESFSAFGGGGSLAS